MVVTKPTAHHLLTTLKYFCPIAFCCVHCVIAAKSVPNIKQVSSIKTSVVESICSLYSIYVLPPQQHRGESQQWSSLIIAHLTGG